MTQVVTFDFATWTAEYPEFAAVSPAQGQAWFNRAGLYFENDTCNPAYAVGATLFQTLYYLLTSHVAWLSALRDANGVPAATGQPPSPIVGRISTASEGSVSVSAEWKGSGSPSEEWFIQTKYGAEFWAATAQFRTARYAARPTLIAGPRFVPYGGRWR